MIEHGATNWDDGLCSACEGGQIALAELMIAHGATDWNDGLRAACEGGHVALVDMMFARGATNCTATFYNSQYIREYVKAQRKLHDSKSVPIIRMLRRYIAQFKNTRRIQRWWRRTYPLWRELAYAPPKGLRYRQGFEHFKNMLKL